MDPYLDQGSLREEGQKQDLLQTILDNSSFVIMALKPDGSCLMLNSAGRRFFGLTPDKPINEFDINVIPEWEKSGLKNLLALTVETKCEQRAEMNFPLPNGGNLWTKVHLIPYHTNGEIHIAVLLEDNTLSHLFNENLEYKLHLQNQALNYSESKYYSLADAVPELIFTVNSDLKISYINQYGLKLFDQQNQNFVGASIHTFFDGKIAPQIKQDVEEILLRKISSRYEYKFPGKNTVLWLSLQLTPIFQPDSQEISILGIGRDVSASKHAEDELRSSQHLFRLIIDNIPQRIFWKDLQSRYIGYNEAFRLDQHIEKPEDLIGKSDQDLSWKEMAEYYQTEEQSIIDNDTPKLEYQELRRMPEGHMLWVRANKVPLHDSAGNTFGILGTYNDITDEKWMEAHLRENELRFRSTFEQAAVGIAHVSPQDQFIIVNERFCEIVEYTKPELSSMGLEELTCPEDHHLLRDFIQRIIDSEQSNFQIETRFLKKDHDYVWVQLTVSRVMNPQGIVQYWVAVIEDISDRILASTLLSQRTNELTRSNQLIGSLSKVSSQLEPTRNPSLVMDTLGKELRKLNVYIQIALQEDGTGKYEIKHSSLPKQIIRKIEVHLHERLIGYKFVPPLKGLSKEGDTHSSLFSSRIQDFLDLIKQVPGEQAWETHLLPTEVPANSNTLTFSLPLQIGDHDLGILEVWGYGIQETDIPAFTVFANQVAAALEASRLYQEIAHQAIRDDLTGLLNRRGFFTLSEQQIRLQSRLNNYLNLVYIDLDEFKQINDSFGHQIGDQALMDAAMLLRKCFRNADIIGRIGGDEFVILTIAKESVDVSKLKNRLSEKFTEFNRKNSRPYQLKFSVGIVSCQLCSETSLDEWLAQADKVMYENKRKHKTDH